MGCRWAPQRSTTTMARRPHPWYWKARKGWYVQYNKKQILLGKADRETTKPPPEVEAEWHRLMMGENLLDATERQRATVPEICEAFLSAKLKLRPATYSIYRSFLSDFARTYK